MGTKPVPVLNRNAHISINNFYNFDMEICNLEFLSRNVKEFDFERFQAKKPEILPYGAFPSRVIGQCLSKCSNSKKTPLP